MKYKKRILQVLIPLLTALAGGSAMAGVDLFEAGTTSRVKDTEQDRRLDKCEETGDNLTKALQDIREDLGLIKGALGIGG